MIPAIAPRSDPPRPRLKWWPVIITFAVALVGYFGAWIWHEVAGLTVTGVDLAEYVKFLPPYRAGQITLLRESFYLPLLAGSLIAGLIASRRVLPLFLRWAAGLLALPLALAMLPPDWSPAVLSRPEYRLQVVMIGVSIAALLLLLITRFLPDALVLIVIALLSLAAAIWPATSFLPLLEPIEALYREPLGPGWGFWLSSAGFILTAFLAIFGAIPRRPQRQRPN